MGNAEGAVVSPLAATATRTGSAMSATDSPMESANACRRDNFKAASAVASEGMDNPAIARPSSTCTAPEVGTALGASVVGPGVGRADVVGLLVEKVGF